MSYKDKSHSDLMFLFLASFILKSNGNNFKFCCFEISLASLSRLNMVRISFYLNIVVLKKTDCLISGTEVV